MVKTAQDGCSEGLVYGGGGREGIFIKEVVPESPASNLKLKEGNNYRDILFFNYNKLVKMYS